MNNFYVTFGFSIADLRNKYLKVKAVDMEHAREFVFKSKIGRCFAFIYDEEEFTPQIEKCQLTEVVLGEIHGF